MRPRSFGVTALAFMEVMVALHAQMGAVALIMMGSTFTAFGSIEGAATLVLGAGYLGLTFAAYTVAYGTWTRKHWAWAGSVVVFGGFVVASILLTMLSRSLIAAPMPILSSVVGFWLLTRPAVKAELSAGEPAAERTAARETLEVAGQVR
jgi:hypothetical protein